MLGTIPNNILHFYTITEGSIGIPWEGKFPPPPSPSQYFFYREIFWLLSWRGADKKIGVRVGERFVCTLRAGSNQSCKKAKFQNSEASYLECVVQIGETLTNLWLAQSCWYYCNLYDNILFMIHNVVCLAKTRLRIKIMMLWLGRHCWFWQAVCLC
jgi:hypothetical protein